jgi:putative heme-binding domain-containing protein
MRHAFAIGLFVALAIGTSSGADEVPLPKVAEGWSIELVAKAPEIAYPTAIVVAPDGTVYLGQDPMDMPGPPTEPIDSVVTIRGGKVATFADKLWAVMGLEWLDGTLFVVHAPYLSAFRDLDGDGKADSRVDLITGLGPKLPGFSGLNDHVASGIKLGMDGFLYIAVGDKGIPRGQGRDGTTITMASGGVIRIRPDGTGLEVVSTGERNPLSVALTAGDDIFTYGNDDDSKKWPNSLTHHIVGGHYGYPYEFLTAPFRALPIVEGQLGGAGAQGICYNEDGLPARYRGNLFFCDWGLQAVVRHGIEPSGGTFRVVSKEVVVEKGDLADFRPFSLAIGTGGASLWLVDWAHSGWLSNGPKTGRLFRLAYTGKDRVEPSPMPTGRIEGLDHPALAIRLESQRLLASEGGGAVGPLVSRLKSAAPGPGRVHSLWALDAIGMPAARLAIRSSLADPDASVRLQAARSSGIRRDREALAGLTLALRDPSPAVRREAAIAVGRLGDQSAGPSLYAALGDTDLFAAWSIRRAIRTSGAWDVAALTTALADTSRREDALKLADESRSLPAIRALAASLETSSDPGWKARVVAALAGNYRRYPEWSGRWFGTNPLAGAMPRKTVDWDSEGMNAVLLGLVKGLRDDDPIVRRQAIGGLIGVGERASPLLRLGLDRESDSINLASTARALGVFNDVRAVPSLAKLLLDPARPVEVRVGALDALATLNSPQALNARLSLAYDSKAPAELVARALPALGRARVLPANDLAAFLYHKSESIRAATLAAFPTGKPLPSDVQTAFLDRLDDPSGVVVKAAIEAVAAHRIAAAVPKLITLAGEEATRVDAMRALSLVPDARAFAVYVATLSDRDPALRKAGESALVAIRDSSAAELESLARSGRFVGPAALAVERILAKFRPMTHWRVLGPFPKTTGQLFESSAVIDFNRKAVGAEARTIEWRARTGEPATGRVVLDDLKGGFGFDSSVSPELAAFAYAEVSSDRDRPALLLVGSSGPVLILVNDRPVLDRGDIAGRPYSPDSDLVRVVLKKGVNRILVRTRQGIGPWCFGAQVSDPSNLSLTAGSGSPGVEGLRAFALSHPGDARSGEALFFEARGIGCAKCHAVGGRGGSIVGPDLAGLAAKYDKAEIVRSVLEPSSRIATGYQPVVIGKKDGSVVTGLLRSETGTHLDLADAEGKPFRVSKAEIEARKVGETSMMPAGLVDSLSPVEFADLIAYLASLKAGK